MTRAGQRALLIMAAMLVLLAGLYVVAVRQQDAYAQRNTCISHYRSDWERRIGDIVITASVGRNVTRHQVDKLRDVQRDLKVLDDRCPLSSWWSL